MKVFVYTKDDLTHNFYKSIEDFDAGVNVDRNSSELVEDELSTYYSYSFSGTTSGSISEYEFEESKPVTFMECDGPSSECCFLVKKGNLDFYRETFQYMKDSIDCCADKGDQISVEKIEHNGYKETKFTYCYEDGTQSDLMTFSFLEDIQLVDFQPVYQL